MLLVLALMAIIASMAWPMLTRAFETQRLRKAADLVRAAWGRARVKALSTGCTHIFQFSADGRRYATHRRTSAEVTVDAAAGGTTEGATNAAAGGGPPGFADASYANPVPFGKERTLPEGVTFLGSETASDSRSEMMAANGDQSGPAGQGWSDPIFFYPDGTTSTARLMLKNERGSTIELTLRGLTGVVMVGDVRAPTEDNVQAAGGEAQGGVP